MKNSFHFCFGVINVPKFPRSPNPNPQLNKTLLSIKTNETEQTSKQSNKNRQTIVKTDGGRRRIEKQKASTDVVTESVNSGFTNDPVCSSGNCDIRHCFGITFNLMSRLNYYGFIFMKLKMELWIWYVVVTWNRDSKNVSCWFLWQVTSDFLLNKQYRQTLSLVFETSFGLESH